MVWMADLPVKCSKTVMDAVRSVEGIRLSWMVAAYASLGIGLYCLVLAFAVEDDFAVLAVGSLVAGYLLTRVAVPRGVSIRTRSQRLVTFAPILAVLVPAALVLFAWPLVAWMVIVINDPVPVWFRDLTGVEQTLPRTIRRGALADVLSLVFVSLALETGWLTTLAFMNACFPDATIWLVRPVLDNWDGRFRWRIFLVCFVAFVISGLAFVLFAGP